jgi:hypothetical protein
MKIYWTTEPNACVLIPTVVLQNVVCGHCDKSHGYAIGISWLVFEFGIVFE